MPCIRGLVGTSGFVLAMAVGVAPPASAETWKPPLSIEAGLPVVEVWVDQRGPYRFLLDTGAEGTTISRELAAALAPSVLGVVVQHTPAGATTVRLVRIAEVRLGRHGPASMGIAAAVSSLSGPRAVLRDLDGILGGDVLSGYDYLVDYRRATLTIASGDVLSVRGGVALPLQIDRGRPLVRWPPRTISARTIGPGTRTPTLLLVDSGADALVIDASTSTFACRTGTNKPASLETHAGRRDVQACEAEAFRLGRHSVHGLQLVSMAWSTAIPRTEQGLLPAVAFERFYVSPALGTVTFWPR